MFTTSLTDKSAHHLCEKSLESIIFVIMYTLKLDWSD